MSILIYSNCPCVNNELRKLKRHLRNLKNIYKVNSYTEIYSTYINYRYIYRSYILLTKEIIIIILLIPMKIKLEISIIL